MDLLKTGAYIQAQRKAVGMTQKKLAQKLNVSFQAVSKWENGDALPDTALLLDLADALQTTVDKLLTGGAVLLKERRRMLVSDVVEGFEHIEAIGRCFGEDSTFYTGMVEGINEKMNIDLIPYLNNPKAREAMIAEVLIQGIMKGYTVDMDEVRQSIKNPKMVEAIERYLIKTRDNDAEYPLLQAAEGYRKARNITSGQILVMRTLDGELRFYENDLSAANEEAILHAQDTPVRELLCCWHNGELDVPSEAVRKGLLAAHPENAEALVILKGGDGIIQKRLDALM